MTQLKIDDHIARLGGHGILQPKDINEMSKAVSRVYQLMKDGEYHSAPEISLVAGSNGIPASEGLRRMRELRSFGYEIERKKAGNRSWKYRLVV